MYCENVITSDVDNHSTKKFTVEEPATKSAPISGGGMMLSRTVDPSIDPETIFAA